MDSNNTLGVFDFFFFLFRYTMVAGKPQPAAPLSAADAEHFKRLSLIRKVSG